MNLTPEIKEAIKKAIDLHGNVTQFAKHLGIAHSTVLFWLSGKTTEVSGRLWAQKLRPALLPFLGATAFIDRPLNKSFFQAREEVVGYGAQTAASLGISSASGLHEATVISFAQAASFDPAIEPIDCYAKDCGEDSAIFANEVKPGYFAIKVEGESMCPDFPPGSVLLVAGGEYPQRGDTVIAKIRSNGQVVVKTYLRKDNIIQLESINPSGKNFEWNCKDNPGFLDWMYPVLEANIDLRAKRWQERRPKAAEDVQR